MFASAVRPALIREYRQLFRCDQYTAEQLSTKELRRQIDLWKTQSYYEWERLNRRREKRRRAIQKEKRRIAEFYRS